MKRHSKPRLKSCLRKRRIHRQPEPKLNRAKLSGTEEEAAETSAATKKRNSFLRFAGPIKIIVVDPQSEYCKTVWCAIGIALTNVAIGAVLFATLCYTLKSDDSHAAVCCFAYHFFAAEAILALHYANGWSAPMRTRHRKFAHFFLHICGIVFAIAGTTVVIIEKGMNGEAHGMLGIVAGALVLLNALIGPLAFRLRNKSWIKTMHMSIGIVAFMTSAVCVCFGFALDSFKTWAGDAVIYLLICCVVFYTVFIVTSSFMKCMSRM